jgi:hypothetical protein
MIAHPRSGADPVAPRARMIRSCDSSIGTVRRSGRQGAGGGLVPAGAPCSSSSSWPEPAPDVRGCLHRPLLRRSFPTIRTAAARISAGARCASAYRPDLGRARGRPSQIPLAARATSPPGARRVFSRWSPRPARAVRGCPRRVRPLPVAPARHVVQHRLQLRRTSDKLRLAGGLSRSTRASRLAGISPQPRRSGGAQPIVRSR